MATEREFTELFVDNNNPFLKKGSEGDLFINTSTLELYQKDEAGWGLIGVLDSLNRTGDKHYTHEQTIPASEWLIAHNLEKYPSVTLLNSSNEEMEAQVIHIDICIVRILFFTQSIIPKLITGKAVFN